MAGKYFPECFRYTSGAYCKKDIQNERLCKTPEVVYPEEAWAISKQQVARLTGMSICYAFYCTRIFEQCHYLLEIQNCLINFYEEPEACMN